MPFRAKLIIAYQHLLVVQYIDLFAKTFIEKDSIRKDFAVFIDNIDYIQ